MGSFAWIIMLAPLAGCGASFVAETPRRAAQVCMTFLGISLILALFVLGYRLAHETTSVFPDVSTLNYLSLTLDPSETVTFPSTFQVALGVSVDNLSASFMVLISFLFLVVQGLGTAMLQHDAGYRRFFWASSLLATLVLGLVLSPGLFQVWVTLGAMSATTLVLALHYWHRRETTAPARRAFAVLLGADASLLLGMAYVIDKLGPYLGLRPQPASGALDIFDFRLLDPSWQAAAQGAVNHVGYRSLVILSVLLAVAALVHAAQAPFTGWLTGLREAPLPVLGAITMSLLAGVVVLARIYTLLMVTPRVLSFLAVIGAVGAVWLSAACLASRDIYRLALLSAAAQLALAITAMGAGGYSAGLLITFVSAPLSLLLLVTAGSLARAYRTRDITEMGGAWRRMRRTSLSLGFWTLAAAGLDLVGYDVVSSVFLNRFPDGGQLTGWVRDLVAVMAIAAVVLTALYAARLMVTVCRGTPAVRRGFVVEKLTEAEPRLRRLQAWCAAGTVAAVVVGLPGIAAIGHGKGRVPALTFSHWIYYGTRHQNLPVEWWALVAAAAALLVGVAGGVLVSRAGLTRRVARLGLWLRIPTLAATGPAAVRAAIAIGTRAGDALAGEVVAFDHELVEPLFDSAGEGIEAVSWSLERARVRRLRIGLGVTLAVLLLLVGASVLAAGGYFPVHTT
ncbi:MAG: proton-conducting transporter membrane subunit [Candidatus Dormibacteria bacterium]|jgi:NADH:ubiquinone oxidoreductase subunit 5 (subunit L)/multisubunit Na+/H+ antiporter MnhA subunit